VRFSRNRHHFFSATLVFRAHTLAALVFYFVFRMVLSRRFRFVVSLGLLALAVACVAARGPKPGPRGLAALAPFPIGACVDAVDLRNNARYREAVLRDYNSVTAEVDMKMNVLQPDSGRFVWDNADYIVRFAAANGMRVHGHTLVWGQALPAWLAAFRGDSAAWENLLQRHIQSTVRHFQPHVRAWDVVNEAYDEGGAVVPTVWRQHLGPEYVARAFRYARAADPTALLFYNDYDIEGSPGKLAGLLRRLDAFKAQGVPIDGVGLQMHIALNTYTPSVIDALNQLSARGYLLHLSELDVAVNPYNLPATQQLTPALLAAQQQKYRDIVAAYRQIPARQQYGITLWGLYDGQTWLRERRHEWPLLYDEQFRPKPAYAGFAEGLRLVPASSARP
jgi:endo-1,4-beta-xylanase